LVSSYDYTLVASADGGATWEPFGPTLPYTPAGIAYSENQKALFVWHSDCGNLVLPDAVQKLSFDFATSTAGLAAKGPRAANVKFFASWVSPTYATAGQSVALHQDMFSDQNVNVTLTVDILNSAGEPVLHSSLDNQALAAQGVTPLVVTVALPTSLPAETYTVKRAAYATDGTQYGQTESSGKFVALAAPPTPTPVPTVEPPPVPGDDVDETTDQSE
jgi:hypothetical protein